MFEREWLEPSEDGEMQDDDVMPDGYRFIFSFFGEPIAVVPPPVPESDSSVTLVNFYVFFL